MINEIYTHSGIECDVFCFYIPEKVYNVKICYICTRKGIIMNSNSTVLSLYLKEKRKILGLTQQQLAIKAGVGLRFIRDLEQGKETLRMDKVNQVLKLFGQELGPVPIDRDRLISKKQEG